MKGRSGVFVGVVFLNDVHISGSFPSPFAALSKQVQIIKKKQSSSVSLLNMSDKNTFSFSYCFAEKFSHKYTLYSEFKISSQQKALINSPVTKRRHHMQNSIMVKLIWQWAHLILKSIR